MTTWILTEGGHVIARSTVQHITLTDTAPDAMKERVKMFDETFLARVDDEKFRLNLPGHACFLQDEADPPDFPDNAANIPSDAEDMMQPAKPDVDELRSIHWSGILYQSEW